MRLAIAADKFLAYRQLERDEAEYVEGYRLRRPFDWKRDAA